MPAPKKSVTTATKTTKAKTSTKPVATASTAVIEAPVTVTKTTTPKTVANPTGTTTVVAQIDVGFGNHLTIRGQGAGLSWTTGQPMTYQNGAWVWQTTSKENFEFKVLANDKSWAQGYNIQAKAGQKIVFKPYF